MKVTPLEPAYSTNCHNEAWHEWDMVKLRIGGLLLCNDPACGEYCSFYGEGEVYQNYYDANSTDYSWEQSFKVKSIFPSPHVIQIPNSTPAEVQDALIASFDSFWIDLGLSANALRRAIECLLDHFGVARQDARGKFVTLAARIKKIKDADPDSHEFADAIRLFANVGSHEKFDDLDMLFDALEAFELYLDAMFSGKKARMKELLARLGLPDNNNNGI